MEDFKIGQPVIYRGKTYTFPGTVCGITDDGQIIVRAVGTPEGYYAGMKHIFGPSQLEPNADATSAALQNGDDTSSEQTDMALIGHSVMRWIETLTTQDGPLYEWSPAEDPAEIIPDLYSMLEESLACHRQACGETKRLETMITTLSRSKDVRWLPIEQADRSITDIQNFSEVGITLRNSDPYWVRDEDGRIYEAIWTEDDKDGYWWDLEGESRVDPVKFMPHPLDPRFAAITEGSDNG
jgi:hypothetical protein